MENLFREFDFEVVYLEDLRLSEQINLISTAEILAGLHGAGLANLIWMDKGGKLIDIVNENYWTESLHRLCFMQSQTYIPHVYPGRIDSALDIENLRFTVRNAIS
jgi:capsular polysaccharide biosynthesis protein